MGRRFAIVWLVLLISGLAAVLAPLPMLNPGKLVEGHRDFESDCTSCHSLFLGLPAPRCIHCHALAEVDAEAEGTSFHRALARRECVTCHTDHQGREAGSATATFTHGSLQRELRERCESCHQAPEDGLHASVGGACARCHQTDAWEDATFAHDSLEGPMAARCDACHRAPGDELHAEVGDQCVRCHDADAWSPATFEHDAYFRFDRHHPSRCGDCHTGGRLDQYTCYGCHEHTPRGIANEHLEEGIRDFERCVDCHRSGDEDEAEHRRGGSGESRDRGTRPRRHHDDDDDDNDDD